MKIEIHFSPECGESMPAVAEYLVRAGYTPSGSPVKTAAEMEAAIEFPGWEISVFHWMESSIFLSVAANTVLKKRLHGILGFFLETCPNGSILLILIRKSPLSHLTLCGQIRELVSEACRSMVLRKDTILP